MQCKANSTIVPIRGEKYICEIIFKYFKIDLVYLIIR